MSAETDETTVVEEQTTDAPDEIAASLGDAHDTVEVEEEAKTETAAETETTEQAPPLTDEQISQREADYSAKVKAFEEREARHSQEREAFLEYRNQLDGRERDATDEEPKQPSWLTFEPQTDNEKVLHDGLKELHEGRQKDRSDLDYVTAAYHKERAKNAATEVAAAKEVLQERFPDLVKDEKQWEKAEQLTIDLIRAKQGRNEDYSITELLTHNIQGLAQPGSAERARTEVHKKAGATAKARAPAGGTGTPKETLSLDESLGASFDEAHSR